MKSINRNDFAEEVRYSWKCTNCEEMNEEYESPDYVNIISCESCLTEFEIKD